jgi:hypothetical protein
VRTFSPGRPDFWLPLTCLFHRNVSLRRNISSQCCLCGAGVLRSGCPAIPRYDANLVH